MNNKLTNDMVIKTATGTPAELNMYAYDVTGAGAVAAAAKACLAGENVRLVSCQKVGHDAPVIKEHFEFATIPGVKVVRHCASKGDPKGGSTMYGSIDDKGDPSTMDVVEVATTMAFRLTRTGNCVFRLK